MSAKYLSYLLTPATVSLAIPLYLQLDLLKKNIGAIFGGVISGVIASLGTVLVMSIVFGLSHKEYVTMLPKSITTAIGMGISEELGGYVTISVAVIIITGVLGNMFAEYICKLFPHQESDLQRTCDRYSISCGRYSKSNGAWRSRGSDEQSGDRGSRSSDRDRILCICRILLNGFLHIKRQVLPTL